MITEAKNRALWGAAVLLYFSLFPLLSGITDDAGFLWVRGLSTVEFVIGLCVFALAIGGSVSSIVYFVSRIAPRLPTTGILVIVISVSSFQPLGPLGGWQLSPFLQFLISVVSALVLEFLSQKVDQILPLLFFGVAGFLVGAVWSAPTPFQIERTSPIALEKSLSDPFSVLFIVIDQVGADQMIDGSGKIPAHLKNLKKFADSATIYTRAVTQYGKTEYAIPAILNGFDARKQNQAVGEQVISEPDRFGLFPISDEFGERFYFSPAGPTPCGIAVHHSSYTCDQSHRAFLSFVKKQEVLFYDLLGHLGWNSFFPIRGELDELTFRQKDYFSRLSEFSPDLPEVGDFVTSVDDHKEFFAFYHYLGTHEPWNLDQFGQPLWSVNEERVNEKGLMNTEKLLELQQRIRHESVLRFDNEFGLLIGQLKSAGRFENTMIIVTSDHGASFGSRFAHTSRSSISIDDTLRQVANVPLLIKFPGQKRESVVSELRFNTQVANEIYSRTSLAANLEDRPTLDESPPTSARFFDIRGATVSKSFPVTRLDILEPLRLDFVGDISSWIKSLNLSTSSLSVVELEATEVRLDDVVWFGNDSSNFQLVRFDVMNVDGIADCDELVVLDDTVIGRAFGEQFNEKTTMRSYFGLLPGKQRKVQVRCLSDTP